MRRMAVVSLLLLVGCAASARAAIPDLSAAQLDRRALSDVQLLREYVAGTRRLVADLQAQRALFEKGERPLTPEERATALDLFEQVLAYEIALDGLAGFHLDFWRIDVLRDPARHARHFAIGYTAYLHQLALGLSFIERTHGKDAFERLLDEGGEARGLPKGSYAKLKWNVVHVEDVGLVFAAHQYHKFLELSAYGKLSGDAKMELVFTELDRAYSVVKGKLQRKGVQLFAHNGFDILRDGGHKAWFPVQARVAEAMGDARFVDAHRSLVSPAQIEEASKKTLPGDVLVERRNWYLSNVGLPGFWPHAALWLGSPAELRTFFDADPEVVAAYGGPLSAALERKFPAAWAVYVGKDAEGHVHRVVEAVSEGVIFTSAEHSLGCDYAAALRPKLTKVQLAKAVERAFGYVGRPYDFDFDFLTDQSLVCSELVFKAYEPRTDQPGLKLPLVTMIGRPTLPPNVMIAQWDRELAAGTPQLEFVWFLDGREREKKAIWGTAETLRASHLRPKWDISQK